MAPEENSSARGTIRFDGPTMRRARRHAGMRQTELGYLVGVSERSVYAWESGKITPRVRRLPRLAEALGISIADLYTGGPHAHT